MSRPARLSLLAVVAVGALHSPALSQARDTTNARPRAVQFSDAYYTRLSIHRIGSYAILPVFAGEYLLGNQLLDNPNTSGGVKALHSVGAFTIGTIFAVNTV